MRALVRLQGFRAAWALREGARRDRRHQAGADGVQVWGFVLRGGSREPWKETSQDTGGSQPGVVKCSSPQAHQGQRSPSSRGGAHRSPAPGGAGRSRRGPGVPPPAEPISAELPPGANRGPVLPASPSSWSRVSPGERCHFQVFSPLVATGQSARRQGRCPLCRSVSPERGLQEVAVRSGSNPAPLPGGEPRLREAPPHELLPAAAGASWELEAQKEGAPRGPGVPPERGWPAPANPVCLPPAPGGEAPNSPA